MWKSHVADSEALFFSKPAVQLVRQQHSGLAICGLAVHQWVQDGVHGHEALLVGDRALGELLCLLCLCWPPTLDECGFVASEFQMEKHLAQVPSSVLLVENHDVFGMDGTTPCEPRDGSNLGFACRAIHKLVEELQLLLGGLLRLHQLAGVWKQPGLCQMGDLHGEHLAHQVDLESTGLLEPCGESRNGFMFPFAGKRGQQAAMPLEKIWKMQAPVPLPYQSHVEVGLLEALDGIFRSLQKAGPGGGPMHDSLVNLV